MEGFPRNIDVFKVLVVDKLRHMITDEWEPILFHAFLIGLIARRWMVVEIRTRYLPAGAINFLVISNLHSDIVFSIVYFLLYPLFLLPHFRTCSKPMCFGNDLMFCSFCGFHRFGV